MVLMRPSCGCESERVNPTCVVDRESLHRRARDIQASDPRRHSQGVGVEELRLDLASVGALSIPLAGTAAADKVSRSTCGNDVCRKQRSEAGPFFVAKGGATFEDDLGEGLERALEGRQSNGLTWCQNSIWRDEAWFQMGQARC